MPCPACTLLVCPATISSLTCGEARHRVTAARASSSFVYACVYVGAHAGVCNGGALWWTHSLCSPQDHQRGREQDCRTIGTTGTILLHPPLPLVGVSIVKERGGPHPAAGKSGNSTRGVRPLRRAPVCPPGTQSQDASPCKTPRVVS